MLFGEFLIKRGVATEEQIVKALDEQKKIRLPLGTVAVTNHFLSIKDVYAVLNRQVEDPEKKFGEIALELGLLTEQELDKIIELQYEKNPNIGEILVRRGVLNKERLFEELNAFVRIKGAVLSE
ncbi:MAG: hypothetical protein CO150_08715 [Nitrospirae bacterium CG_4_9_14_3_um_filter_53_35]|nr:MAG: hypothetical protein AUK29_08930 [Nitrospirae bacterium CG2_30_53_67]PIS38361.1 MAG: hypothetical protein COT35_01125 [Nitrospirae bacterium CG08_land_8_20_14_0_20_52_24]PIV82629.1 MAG: hypothetical protein COW52_12505 [Nitrospirae bacterium CG17_big_fil_post_rev_8_21_14_2_50_50_9]PIW84322.1 MAG: hypothetical protein COZ95_10390 [Nitrospirae bacterium CG_4_8_14_3_um_filter_50_41]PIX86009.1 MAG: hypothetical protein COZ32_05440 [Nitrospirae bacterium CG_4_10_14_3_um_filter_53_41]PJA7306